MNGHSGDGEQSAPGWLAALLNPFFLFQGLTEVFTTWLFTRFWRRIALGLTLLLILLLPVSLVLRGALLERDQLLMRYSLLVEEELQQAAEGERAVHGQTQPGGAGKERNKDDETESGETKSGETKSDETKSDETQDGASRDGDTRQGDASSPAPLMREEKTDPYADLLYRRLLRMDDQNPRTRYMIALRLARIGRVSQARQFMHELAPVGGRGYPPAHAWLAVDLLSRHALTDDARTALVHHLSQTLDWDGVGGGLLTVYAQLLADDGKRKEALDVMAKAVRKDAALQSAFVIMARRLNMPKLAEESSAAAKKTLLEKVESDEASEQDFVQLSLLQLTDDQPEAALETARKGLKSQATPSQQIKHLASEALRILYRKSIRQTDSGFDLNLALLDEAMRMYPANPNLSTEIAQLGEMGIIAPPSFKAGLQQQLFNGQATALAHLLLANQELKAGHIDDAIPHLELALRQAPNHPVILNNLALALALTGSDQLERAERLIAQAIAINSRNPEYYDTQGEIRLLAGRPLDAIESLEKALAISSDRQHTRELMVKAYRAAGMDELAAEQEKLLAEGQHTAASG